MGNLIRTKTYFDGQKYFKEGPYQIETENSIIKNISMNNDNLSEHATSPLYEFVMPSFTEAHCHLFLDGDEKDQAKRMDYLKRADISEQFQMGLKNLQRYWKAGVTLIRDAGDINGINHKLREYLQQNQDKNPTVRSPGMAIRKKKKYGSFMALEVDEEHNIEDVLNRIAPTADDLKIILTGIIDFESASVKTKPQFDLEEAKRIVSLAQTLNKKTFAHCSGLEGLQIAVDAGIGSIEHGFFMTKAILHNMFEKQITWVPTFCPVYFQWREPQYFNWNSASVDGMFQILENHRNMIKQAFQLGVPVLLGTDAGSYGVPHAASVLQEIKCILEAGVNLEAILRSATVLPRIYWGEANHSIIKGNKADFIMMNQNPFDDIDALQKIQGVSLGNHIFNIQN